MKSYVFAALLGAAMAAEDWGYLNGGDDWTDTQCKRGNEQSPINLDKTIEFHRGYLKADLTGFHQGKAPKFVSNAKQWFDEKACTVKDLLDEVGQKVMEKKDITPDLTLKVERKGKPSSSLYMNDAITISGAGSRGDAMKGKLTAVTSDWKESEWEIKNMAIRQPSEHTVLGQNYPVELQMTFKPAGKTKKKLKAKKLKQKYDASNSFKVMSDSAEGISKKNSGAMASILFSSVADCTGLLKAHEEEKAKQALVKAVKKVVAKKTCVNPLKKDKGKQTAYEKCEEARKAKCAVTDAFFDSLNLNQFVNGGEPVGSTKSSANEVALYNLIKSVRQKYFYSYAGSLTYPPCTEGIQWTVYAKALPICSENLDKLKKLYSDYEAYSGKLRGNNRRTQPLNGREIIFNSAAGGSFSSAVVNASLSVAAASVAAAALNF